MPTTIVVELVGPWEVQVIPVPPHASYKWHKAHVDIPDRPPPPTTEAHSELTGHTESLPALPESAEYVAWQAAEAEWAETARRLTNEAAEGQMVFSMDYAIKAWRPKGSDGEWQYQPPDDWEPNEALSVHGVGLQDDVRIQFIMLELLEHPGDYDLVRLAAYPGGELDMSPVTAQEVGAAMASFRPGDDDAGHEGVGGHSRARRRRHQDVAVRGGDADGGRRASAARRLVFLFTGR